MFHRALGLGGVTKLILGNSTATGSRTRKGRPGVSRARLSPRHSGEINITGFDRGASQKKRPAPTANQKSPFKGYQSNTTLTLSVREGGGGGGAHIYF